MSDQPSVIKPSLTAGLIFGFISGLPFISYLNCICCSLILGAGILSSYLLVKASAVGVTYSRAALGGFLTGLFAAPIWFLTNVAIMIIVGYDLSSRMQDLFDQVGASTPETQQVIQLLSGAGIYLVLAIAFAFSTALYSLFGTLGGLLGRSLFEKRPVPAPVSGGRGGPTINGGPPPAAPGEAS